jgi:putative transposase
MRNVHTHLPRLTRIWTSNPIFFITTCTYHRNPILANNNNANILIDEWKSAYKRHGWLIGRYVIMPDHVHFFCSFAGEEYNPDKNALSIFMRQWKQWTSKRMIRENRGNLITLVAPIWQREFFDHLLRSEESYIQKWEYVYENPVRRNMVTKPDDWPWQGEIFDLSV